MKIGSRLFVVKAFRGREVVRVSFTANVCKDRFNVIQRVSHGTISPLVARRESPLVGTKRHWRAVEAECGTVGFFPQDKKRGMSKIKGLLGKNSNT